MIAPPPAPGRAPARGREGHRDTACGRPAALRRASTTAAFRLVFADVLGDRLHDGLACATDQLVTFVLCPFVRRTGRFELTFEVRDDFAGHQLVAVICRLG